MKILMISMFANHFFNWVDQLRDSGHEVYWIDVFDNGQKVDRIDWLHQTVGWKRKWNYPGRNFFKKNFPQLQNQISRWTEKDLEEIVEESIRRFEPEVVQSFVLFSACAPILGVMKKYPTLKWIYSAWGNDLYYFQNIPKYLKGIEEVLPRVDYMFTDCNRDYTIAKEHGFKGTFLGSFPGGGGYELETEVALKPVVERNLILIKGYQALFGECIPVLKAVLELKNCLSGLEIVIFGADPEVVAFLDSEEEFKTIENLRCLGSIGRSEVIGLMGDARIYVGNSVSDGMPNTLLEAIIMGAFPIQSNPGGASAEIVTHYKNGLLITDPFNVEEIAALIRLALTEDDLLTGAFDYNTNELRPTLEREHIRQKVLKQYKKVELNT